MEVSSTSSAPSRPARRHGPAASPRLPGRGPRAGRTGPLSVHRRVRVTGGLVLDADDRTARLEWLPALRRAVFRIVRVQAARYRGPDRPCRTRSAPSRAVRSDRPMIAGCPGIGGPDHAARAQFQPREIPGRGRGEAQMRIVGQQRAARGRARRRGGPGVGGAGQRRALRRPGRSGAVRRVRAVGRCRRQRPGARPRNPGSARRRVPGMSGRMSASRAFVVSASEVRARSTSYLRGGRTAAAPSA